MTIHTHEAGEKDSAYDGLLVDDAHWAFGAGGETGDPLADLHVTVPDGVEPAALAAYCLMLGDDALILAHRLSEWCSRAPELEEDIALANIALDLLGQARLLLTRAAAADPGIVPPGLPATVPGEDALAFFRDEHDFRNAGLVELPNGDFAETVTRLVLFSTYRLALFGRLASSRDPVLAAVAAKGRTELAYHRDFAARWFVVLAQGTDESRRRLLTGLGGLAPLWPELFVAHPVEAAMSAEGVGVDPSALTDEVEAVLGQIFEAADVPALTGGVPTGAPEPGGRDGRHTAALSLLLAEMQAVAREHPAGRW